MLTNDSLYHDATIFDQLLGWGKQCLAEQLPSSRAQRWGRFFYAFSAVLSGIGIIMLITGFQQTTQPAFTAHLFSALLLGLATYHFRTIAQKELQAKTATVCNPDAPPVQHPVDTIKPDELPGTDKPNPRQFFRTVRDAGINVKIARALYSGGVQSAEILNTKTDQELLAIHGVGPATVRKLRSHFDSVESYYDV